MTRHHFDNLMPDEQRRLMPTSPYEELRRRDPTRPNFKSVLEPLALLSNRGEKIGVLLRTRDGVKPIYVSIGHQMDLATARRLVLDCGEGYRLPEPTRLADRLVARAKRELPAAGR